MVGLRLLITELSRREEGTATVSDGQRAPLDLLGLFQARFPRRGVFRGAGLAGLGLAGGIPGGVALAETLFSDDGSQTHTAQPQAQPAPYVAPYDIGGIVTPPGQGYVSSLVFLHPEKPMRVSYSPMPKGVRLARVDGTGFIAQGENLIGGPLGAPLPDGTRPAPFFGGMLTCDTEPGVWHPVAQVHQLFEDGVEMVGWRHGAATIDDQGNSVTTQTSTTVWGMQVVLPKPVGRDWDELVLQPSMDPIMIATSRSTEWVGGAQLPIITIQMMREGLFVAEVNLVPQFAIDSFWHQTEFDPLTQDGTNHPLQVVTGTRHAYSSEHPDNQWFVAPAAPLLPGRVHMDRMSIVPWASDPDSAAGKPQSPEAIPGMIVLPAQDLNDNGTLATVGSYARTMTGFDGTITGLQPRVIPTSKVAAAIATEAGLL